MRLPPDELTLTKALELLENGQHDEEPLGVCPKTQKPVYLKQGRFGPYVQFGDADDPDKRNASLLQGMEPSDINIDVALQLLSLPRDLGPHPENQEPVVVSNGRYGPYVKWGSETRSLPAGTSPLNLTHQEALALLAQPKARGRGRSAPREALRVFEASPVTSEPIKLMDGRYGPYVTDGTTNASLPKDMTAESVTFAQAVDLLAARAAKAPTRKRAVKKKTAKKKTATKSTTKKKATKKKATRRRRSPRRAHHASRPRRKHPRRSALQTSPCAAQGPARISRRHAPRPLIAWPARRRVPEKNKEHLPDSPACGMPWLGTSLGLPAATHCAFQDKAGPQDLVAGVRSEHERRVHSSR